MNITSWSRKFFLHHNAIKNKPELTMMAAVNDDVVLIGEYSCAWSNRYFLQTHPHMANKHSAKREPTLLLIWRSLSKLGRQHFIQYVSDGCTHPCLIPSAFIYFEQANTNEERRAVTCYLPYNKAYSACLLPRGAAFLALLIYFVELSHISLRCRSYFRWKRRDNVLVLFPGLWPVVFFWEARY